MPPAPLPPNESERLAALLTYDILDAGGTMALDDIVTLAARLTRSPMAAISLMAADRQWFSARIGLEASEAPRDVGFCAYAILDPLRALAVVDAAEDPRFADNPLVCGPPGIRSYLGAPIVNPEGQALGALCVLDHVPRHHDEAAIHAIRTLAHAAAASLELRRTSLRTQQIALTDSLTGLPNRRAMTQALGEIIGRGQPVALISVDLDHFKEVNDAEGHAAGDALLQAAAERLRASVRPGDLVGRLGSDEFVAFIIGITDRDTLAAVADRIRAALHRPVPYGRTSLRLGGTLGAAMAPADAAAPEMLMRVADEALLRAKRESRGGIGWARRTDAEGLVRAATVVRAFDAEPDRLEGAVVHFQPIVALKEDAGTATEVTAFEALARWHHPEFGEMSPGEIFPILGPERTARLGHAVRDRALRGLNELRAAGLTGARVALNLSACEVAQPDIALRIGEQVERAGFSLRAVEIEITEEVLLERVSERTLDQLATLRGRGARLVLDDFGTGNSGLSQLLRLPLDAVKLDKRFVQRLSIDTRAEEIVRATVSLARALHLDVVAEGVETERQAAIAQALGCRLAQGYHFARPMPPGALKAWLQHASAAGGTEPASLLPGPVPNSMLLLANARTTTRRKRRPEIPIRG